MPNSANNSEVNHVYILGAGFSYPMGGPLFADLFSQSIPYRFLNFTEFDPDVLNQPDNLDQLGLLAQFVKVFPNYYRGFKQTNNIDNPEQFLEYCDCALNDKEVWFTICLLQRFHQLNRERQESLSANEKRKLIHDVIIACKIRLVLETNTFVSNIPDDSDRWSPYSQWFDKLGTNDTIISLNYDLLVETIAQKAGRPFPGRDFKLKEDCARVDDLLAQNEREANLPLLCKVHGSVDWIEENDVAFAKRYTVDDCFFGYTPLLGTPGTGKIGLSKGSLKRVWQTALERLRQAHVISIVGYSLPQTDNDFRIKLLDSIVGTNGNLKAINIVLGPPTPHSQRAQAILKQATKLSTPCGKSIEVNLLPIYAQDYLPYYRPRNESEIRDHAFS